MQCQECNRNIIDFGPGPFVVNMSRATNENMFFRRALWTGCHLQLTLMCIKPCEEIGLEIHPDEDQFLCIEEGQATVLMGKCREKMNYKDSVGKGDAIFIPAGTWHNVINTGKIPLKLYSIYAPSHHPRGTVHRTKEDAE